mmetsp:Transcript_34255/g.90108  ORF Transcript_34255/g.90108 Transcript_34255/m.90108 type:complete len:114 (-) Transcript_34255:216-557(-)
MTKQFLGREDVVEHLGPLAESDLIDLLEAQVPIMIAFVDEAGGGHVELLGGCDPAPPYPLAGDANTYFLHDPMTDRYMNKTYHDILTGYGIQPPWGYAWYVPPSTNKAQTKAE